MHAFRNCGHKRASRSWQNAFTYFRNDVNWKGFPSGYIDQDWNASVRIVQREMSLNEDFVSNAR
jgi:hypothetical protein